MPQPQRGGGNRRPANSAVELKFRRLAPADAAELSYLELRIFRAPWSQTSLRDCLLQKTVEGEAALVDQRIVGYLIVQTVEDEAHILNLAVDPSLRGRGVSRILMERFLKRAVPRGISIFYLEVRAGNRVAQNLYFSLGFAPVAVRRNYYPDGEDALILVKKL